MNTWKLCLPLPHVDIHTSHHSPQMCRLSLLLLQPFPPLLPIPLDNQQQQGRLVLLLTRLPLRLHLRLLPRPPLTFSPPLLYNERMQCGQSNTRTYSGALSSYAPFDDCVPALPTCSSFSAPNLDS